MFLQFPSYQPSLRLTTPFPISSTFSPLSLSLFPSAPHSKGLSNFLPRSPQFSDYKHFRFMCFSHTTAQFTFINPAENSHVVEVSVPAPQLARKLGRGLQVLLPQKVYELCCLGNFHVWHVVVVFGVRNVGRFL